MNEGRKVEGGGENYRACAAETKGDDGEYKCNRALDHEGDHEQWEWTGAQREPIASWPQLRPESGTCPVCREHVPGGRRQGIAGNAPDAFFPLTNHSAHKPDCVYAPVPAGDVKRVPVEFRYDAINPEFLKRLARIGHYASEKYGAWEQYTKARLVGDKSPINHAYEHLRCYQMGEPYDHFDGDPRWHLVAVAYNCMMEFFYAIKFGLVKHPLDTTEGDR